MNSRAVLVLLGVAVVAPPSCGKGTIIDDHASSSLTRAEIDRPPTRCTREPWVDGGHPCGVSSIVERRITCGDLGMSGVTLMPADHGDGDRSATHHDDNGIDSDVVNGVVQVGGQTLRDWTFGATVNPDGSTMTSDALVFVAARRSYVVRFSEPQFYVRHVHPTIGEVESVQLCGYRPGRAASLPPPEPDAGPFTVTCSGNGSSIPPGATVHSESEIQWAVKVAPAPAQGALVAMSAEVDDAQSLGNRFMTLANGELSGGYSNGSLRGRHGSLALQFGYGSGSCRMYWNVVEEQVAGSVRTW